jgi:hypothetical protein
MNLEPFGNLTFHREFKNVKYARHWDVVKQEELKLSQFIWDETSSNETIESKKLPDYRNVVVKPHICKLARHYNPCLPQNNLLPFNLWKMRHCHAQTCRLHALIPPRSAPPPPPPLRRRSLFLLFRFPQVCKMNYKLLTVLYQFTQVSSAWAFHKHRPSRHAVYLCLEKEPEK